MLLQDEVNVVRWLTQYGVLPRTQLTRLLKAKTPRVAEKILQNTVKQYLVYDIAEGYYLGTDPMGQPDQRAILAVWVLLQFIDRIDPTAHYPATFPSQLFFLKDDTGYEIVVLYEGEAHLTRLLQPDEDLKYIIVLPHISMAKELRLPTVPCLFATVDYKGEDVPVVTFYSGEEVHSCEAAKVGL